MKRFSIILLALVLLVPVIAQEDAAAAAFERLVPSNVRLRLNEETGVAELVFNAEPAVCEPLITEVSVEGNVIDVDAYVPLSAQGATCNFIAPYEPVIELGELEGDISYVLLLNDFATTFFLPQVGGIIMDMPFSVLWGEDNNLIPFSRVDSYVNSSEITVVDGTVNINIEGSHTNGCESEVYTWVQEDDADIQQTYHIQVFRLLPQAVMCPDMMQDFELSIDTGLPADGEYLFELGDNWFSYSAEEVTPVAYIPVTVESMTIVAEGDNYRVTMNGSVPDCGTTYTQGMIFNSYASYVSVALLVALDAECDTSTTKPFTGDYVVDALPLIFNGVAYDENGVIEANASAAGVRPDPSIGANTMQVDTVIESVDVLILESFPMQLDLVVKGYQPDGCDYPVVVEQSREGNVVTVHVYREVPTDIMCTMQIVPYEETIRLEGGFEGGTIEIHVNDFTTSVDL